MAARSLRPRPFGRIWSLAAAGAVLVAFRGTPVLPAPAVAEEQKVWRALSEGDRRGQPPPVAPGVKPTKSSSRDEALVNIAVGIALAVCAGVAVVAFGLARRPRQAPATPRTKEPVPGSEIEQLWRRHLERKRR